MNVLIVCECSQTLCKAFRRAGHIAYSCDIEKCYGGHPEWHIVGDALEIAHVDKLVCEDGSVHDAPLVWDLIIAHPPCTFLSKAQWYCYDKTYRDYAYRLWRVNERSNAIQFFKSIMALYPLRCDRLAIENPYGTINVWIKPASQEIRPNEFGEDACKSTCLWLFNLPLLKPTNIVECTMVVDEERPDHMISKWYADTRNLPLADRTRVRSKTFDGIANAIVDQWGC